MRRSSPDDSAADRDRTATPAAPRAQRHPSPERIGPYRLIRKIGEGGMGIVWEAEQEQPIRRKVAIKLVKHGLNSEAACSPASRPSARRWP